MRISNQDLQSIKVVFKKWQLPSSRIYVFGSRVDPSKKGGDLDLLILFDSDSDLESFKKLDFLVDLKKQIGDRRIDVTTDLFKNIDQDPFLTSIMSSAVELI